jgi:hypothetical protein
VTRYGLVTGIKMNGFLFVSLAWLNYILGDVGFVWLDILD